MANLNTPVVFIIFNRPDLSQIVFESIRLAQPKQLFVIADGARFPEEFEKCKQTREIIKQVDWDCQVLTNYSDINLGCRQRVSSGIDWVFEHVEEAIILEDDCLPHPSFFGYCQELLDHYREDERIWCISGDNFQNGKWRGNGSYYFSNYNHCWGWASWRRAWQHYNYDLSNWQTVRDGHYLSSILDSELEIKYWCDVFERLDKLGEPNSWAYPWAFTCWQNSGLAILPNVNLVSNIGCRSDGTHIIGDSKLANIPVKDIGQIRHPSFIVRDRAADEYTFEHVFGGKEMRELTLRNKTLKGKLIKKLNFLKSKLKSLKKNIRQ